MSKKTIIIIVSCLTVVLSIIGGLMWGSLIQKDLVLNLTNQFYAQEKLIGEETNNLLRAEMLSLQDKLHIISQIPSVRTADNTEACNQQLQAVRDSMNIKVNNIGRVDVNGKFVCSLNPALIGLEAANFGEYITDIFKDPQHKPVMSRATRVPNVEGQIFAIHIPVYDEDGNFDGTLGGAIYFSDLEKNYLKNIVFANSGYIVLFDDNGDILYHPQPDIMGKNYFSAEYQTGSPTSIIITSKIKEAIAGNIGTLRYTTNAGEEKIAVMYPIEIFPGRKWIANITVPVKEIESTIFNTEIKTLFTVLTLGGVTAIILPPFIILLYLLFTIFRPISRVTKSIINVSNGNFDEKVDYIARSPKDEIGQLATAFNNMSSQLKDLYQNLNKKVAEQTAEVEKEKNSLEIKVQQRTAELNEAKTNLEQKVIERTAELTKSIEELQRFNKVMIDREKRMIELKQKIDQLESQANPPRKKKS